MKLLFQSDDYGFTDSITYGILKAINQGVVRNTGLFVNMPSSENAANLIREIKGICVGQDINLVAGKPVSDPRLIPSLVDDSGNFISSVQRMNEGKVIRKVGTVLYFETDPYDYDEVLLEIDNQVKRFIQLMDRKPGYLHGHSLSTPNIKRAMEEVAKKYTLKLSYKITQESSVERVVVNWNPKPFSFDEQMNTNVEEKLVETLGKYVHLDKVSYICHCGFLEEELFPLSTYTAIRMKDLEASISVKLKEFIKENNIELITYNDL